MHWIADLKQHMRELRPQILIFCEEYPIQEEDAQMCVEGLLSSTNNFAAWVSALPSDANVWRWVDWPTAFYDARRHLTTLEGYFDVLLIIFDEQRDFVDDHQPLPPHAEIIRKQINLISEIYHQSRERNSEFSWSAEADTEQLPAYIVLHAIWPHVYPWYLDRVMDISVFEIETWPAVLYHPYYTPAALCQIIAHLARVMRDLLVTPRRTDAAFEIHVTHPTMHMTPALWETYRDPLQHRDSLEYLRELGGSIEPLTWDEGQGQGVIIRLPWAK